MYVSNQPKQSQTGDRYPADLSTEDAETKPADTRPAETMYSAVTLEPANWLKWGLSKWGITFVITTRAARRAVDRQWERISIVYRCLLWPIWSWAKKPFSDPQSKTKPAGLTKLPSCSSAPTKSRSTMSLNLRHKLIDGVWAASAAVG